jgi:iron complex transport system substrate-binding protein
MTERPPRLVSLCPSITETLFSIGAGGRLAGVTRYCTRPREGVRALPKVGGTKNPDVAAILRLRPDLVFVNSEENRAEDIERLRSQVAVHESMPTSVAEVPALVRSFGRAAGPEGAAEALAERIERRLRALSPPPAGLFRYAYVIWKDPWMCVSGNTYVSDLLRYAGGENVIAKHPDRYPSVLPREIADARPDLAFFASEPFPFSEKHRGAIEGAFGPEIRIEFIDGDDCCWHGARTLPGLDRMESLRHRAVRSGRLSTGLGMSYP